MRTFEGLFGFVQCPNVTRLPLQASLCKQEKTALRKYFKLSKLTNGGNDLGFFSFWTSQKRLPLGGRLRGLFAAEVYIREFFRFLLPLLLCIGSPPWYVMTTVVYFTESKSIFTIKELFPCKFYIIMFVVSWQTKV